MTERNQTRRVELSRSMEILDSHARSPPEKKREVDDEFEEDRVNGSSESKNSVITTESFESRESAMSKGSSGSEESALLSAGDEQKVLRHHRIPPFVEEKVGFKVCYSREGEESSDEDMGFCFSENAYRQEIKETDNESSDEDMGYGFSDNAYRQEIKETDNGDEQKVLPHHRIPPFVKDEVGFKVYYSCEDKESSDEDMGYCFSNNVYQRETKDIEIVQHAMREYDAKNDTNLQLVDITPLNCECGGPMCSYITFQAKDCDDGDVKTYQTRVRIIHGEKVIEEVRLKPGEN